MLLAFYFRTSISFYFLYLFISVRYFLISLYICIFTFAFNISLFKDCRLAIESLVFFIKLLTRERLFNFSIMPPGYSSSFRFIHVLLTLFWKSLSTHLFLPYLSNLRTGNKFVVHLRLRIAMLALARYLRQRTFGCLNEEEESLFMTLRTFDSLCRSCSSSVTLNSSILLTAVTACGLNQLGTVINKFRNQTNHCEVVT